MEYKTPISLEVISSHINHPVKLLTSRLQAPSYYLNWDRSARINNFPSPSFVQAPKLQWNLHQLRSGKVREGYFLNSRWRLPPMSWFIKVTHTKCPDLIDDRGWSVAYGFTLMYWNDKAWTCIFTVAGIQDRCDDAFISAWTKELPQSLTNFLSQPVQMPKTSSSACSLLGLCFTVFSGHGIVVWQNHPWYQEAYLW